MSASARMTLSPSWIAAAAPGAKVRNSAEDRDATERRLASLEVALQRGLAEVPGVTIVEAQWWLSQLDWLARTLELVEPTSGIT